MTPAEHQQIADDLNRLILDTLDLIDNFETHGMNTAMADDYEQLHTLLASATKQFREHSLGARTSSEAGNG